MSECLPRLVLHKSETIRKPPFAEAQIALRKQKRWYSEERFSMWLWEYHIEFVRWQHPAMWHV